VSKKKGTKQYIVKDPYFLEAKKLGYRARSAFKLLEIQEKFGIIQPDMNVCDVGAAPGSFLQIISKIISPEKTLIGIDIQKIKNLGKANVFLLQADINDFETVATFCATKGIEQFDLVTSDIGPNTTGMTGVDQYRSVELNIAIIAFAEKFLKKWWNLLLKVFVGEDVQDLITPIKNSYTTLRRIKPHACRDRSFEEYFICIGKK
jgi:23S rRNA (uridine2552-2'-O)-methyltransferase